MVTAHAPCHRVTASRAPDTHLHSQPGRTQRGGPRRPWPASPACRWRAPRPSSATHGNVYFFFRAKKGKERRKKGVLSGGESLRMFKQMSRGAAPPQPPGRTETPTCPRPTHGWGTGPTPAGAGPAGSGWTAGLGVLPERQAPLSPPTKTPGQTKARGRPSPHFRRRWRCRTRSLTRTANEDPGPEPCFHPPPTCRGQGGPRMPPGPSEATCGEGGAARGRGTEGGPATAATSCVPRSSTRC